MIVELGLVLVIVFVIVFVIWLICSVVRTWSSRNIVSSSSEGLRCPLCRTLVYVVDVNWQADTFSFVIPEWSKNKRITKRIRDLPEHLCGCISFGKRLYVNTNLGADDVDDLWFEDWESEQ